MHAKRLRRVTLLLLSNRLAATAIAAALGCGPAAAQSLRELYEAAHAYDASYLAAKAQADSAVFSAAQADALKRPSANLQAGVSRTFVQPPNFPGINSDTTQVQVQASQPLYNRGNDATIAQAYKSLDASQSDLEAAEQDLIVRVTQAYFDVLGAQDTLGYARQSKTAITEQLAAAKRNFEVGTATITDTREAQARYDLATATEIAADNDLRTKRVALDLLVGRSDVTPKPMAVPVTMPPPSNIPVEEWLTRADGTHPTIVKAKLALDVARLDTEKARASALPTVSLVGSVGREHDTASYTQLPGRTNSASIGLQLAVPLYTGHSIQNRIKETLILEDKAQDNVNAAQRGVALNTRQAYLSVQSGEAQVKALEAAESSTQLALEATQLGYKVGVRVNIDVLNAQTQLFQTQRDLAKSRYDLLVGRLRLRQAAGQLRPDDLMAIETLLSK